MSYLAKALSLALIHEFLDECILWSEQCGPWRVDRRLGPQLVARRTAPFSSFMRWLRLLARFGERFPALFTSRLLHVGFSVLQHAVHGSEWQTR